MPRSSAPDVSPPTIGALVCPICSTPPPSARYGPEALESYNNDLYRHYLEDFNDVDDLKDHVEARIRYLLAGQAPMKIESALSGIATTAEWWFVAKRARADMAGVAARRA